MSKSKSIIVLFLVANLLISCSSQASYANEVGYDMVEAEEAPAAAPMEAFKYADGDDVYTESTVADAGGGYDESSVQNLGSTQKRIVIKNANLSVVVVDPTQAMAQITSMADEMGGFTVSSELYQTTTKNGVEVPEGNITVRVPAEQLNEALEKIKKLTDDPSTDILSESISGQDVTREYTDLQSRLTNLENTQAQLEIIMAEAKKTEDVLSVYLELTSINEQIEVIKGQIKYYDETSSLSAISIRLVAQESVEPLTIGKWEPKGIARDAVQSLIEAIKFIISALIWIILFVVPVLIIIAIPVVIIVILIRSLLRRRKKSSKGKKAGTAGTTAPDDKHDQLGPQ